MQPAVAQNPEVIAQQVEQPANVLRIDELASYKWTEARAARFIGRVLAGELYIDPVSEIAPNTSLHEAIQRAKGGDAEALACVRTNAHIAGVEAMLKAGHVTEVRLERNEGGNWLQHGQAMSHVHANALVSRVTQLHPGLAARAKAEVVNGHRIEDVDREGALEDYWVFVPSLFPDESEVPFDIATEKAGFFGETMTAALQLTTVEGDEGVVQTAFVAGKGDKTSMRYDIEAMRKLYALAGVESENMEPIDFLQTPLLIRKDQLPNGVTDLAQLYDQLVGEEAFFGQQMPKQDYVSFLETCQQREVGMQAMTDRIVTELLDRSDEVQNPEDAIVLLAEIVRVLGPEHAVADSTIDPRVFGAAASVHIEQARLYAATGDLQRLQYELGQAKQKSESTMCGITTRAEDGLDPQLREEKVNEKDSDEDCEFTSKMCPECKAKDVKTVVKKVKNTNLKTITGSCGCSVTKKAA